MTLNHWVQPTQRKFCAMKVQNRHFATNNDMVQNPPCWWASSLLIFPHWDENKEALTSQAWLPFVMMFQCGNNNKLASIAYFVPSDRMLQKVPWSTRHHLCSAAPTSAPPSLLSAFALCFVNTSEKLAKARKNSQALSEFDYCYLVLRYRRFLKANFNVQFDVEIEFYNVTV